jgi:hypothetical protein
MTRLFFLSKEGWFEEEISGKLLHATQEELVLWAYAMMERKNYRNYLITDNPVPSLRARFTGRSNLLEQAEPAQAPQHNIIPFHTDRLLRRQNHS